MFLPLPQKKAWSWACQGPDMNPRFGSVSIFVSIGPGLQAKAILFSDLDLQKPIPLFTPPYLTHLFFSNDPSLMTDIRVSILLRGQIQTALDKNWPKIDF